MSRCLGLMSLLTVLGVSTWFLGGANAALEPVDKNEKAVIKETGRPVETFAQLRAKLAKVVSVDFSGDPPQTLGAALDLIGKRFDLTTTIDHQAFKSDLQIEEPQNAHVRFKGANVELLAVIEILARQTNGTVLIRNGYIEITTVQQKVREMFRNGGELPNRSSLMMVPANDVFEKVPFRKAVAKLVHGSSLNLVIDEKRVGDKADAPVTGSFNNVSMDTAMRILANMVDLKAVIIDNVIYVTTPENAKVLDKETKELHRIGPGDAPMIGPAGPGGC